MTIFSRVKANSIALKLQKQLKITIVRPEAKAIALHKMPTMTIFRPNANAIELTVTKKQKMAIFATKTQRL